MVQMGLNLPSHSVLEELSDDHVVQHLEKIHQKDGKDVLRKLSKKDFSYDNNGLVTIRNTMIPG